MGYHFLFTFQLGKNLCLSGVDKIYLFNDSDHKIIDYSSNEVSTINVHDS